MRVKLALFLIILLIAIPHISAVDTSDWIELTVNNVDFKIPDKYFNESKGKNHIKSYRYSNQFAIISCVDYNTLKKEYGYDSTSEGLVDITQTSVSGHDLIHIYDNYKSRWDSTGFNTSYVFFSTGTKIFKISYKRDKITNEIKEIIKNTPKSKMSEETFITKLDNAQRDYLTEEYNKNLELDLEDYYRTYNDEHDRGHFYYWGTNGFGVGGTHRY